MPEGPECKAYATSLHQELCGRTITEFAFVAGRYSKNLPEGFEKFSEQMPCKVLSVKVKGKFIYFTVETTQGITDIWNTLGLTGGWSSRKDKNLRAIIKYDGEELYFSDQRNFGTLKFGNSLKETQDKLDSLGHDFLLGDVACTKSLSIFKIKRNQGRTLAEILMDQRNYAGVGNYIKAEALYRAQIAPHRTGSSLIEAEIIKLHESIQNIMREAYQARPTALIGYKDLPVADTKIFHKVVYRKFKDPLGNEVKAEDTKDKRTTYWVPAIQR